MAFEPIPGFRSLETYHCVTGSMRHIFDFHEFPVSEELLLGLGAGVGFVYWHMKGTAPFFGGRANVGRAGEEGLEKTASRRLGVEVHSYRTSSVRKAEKAMIEMLISGKPLMVQVDMGFLPYLDFGEVEYHFGYHVVVIAGYNPETRQVLIADRDMDLHPISLEDLAKARGSTFKPFPPRHRWYTYDFSQAHSPNPAEVNKAIWEVTSGMLEPPISNLGVKGIRKAANRVPQWTEVMDANDLRLTCFNIFIFIDAMGGSGGGLFRYMYGRFLIEAADITGKASLITVGKKLIKIGDLWQELAEIFKDAHSISNPADLLPETVKPLMEIADQEQDVWEHLREIVVV